MTLQRSQPPGKRPKKERWRLSAWLRYFFNILLLILLWQGFADLLGGYFHTVATRFVARTQTEDIPTILSRGDWKDVLDIPQMWRHAPGWFYIVAAILLVIAGILLLIGYLKATRKLSDMFWETLEEKMRKLIRTEFERSHRFWIRLIVRLIRWFLQHMIVMEESLPFEDTLPENAADDERITEINIQIIPHRDPANHLYWDIRTRMRIPARLRQPTRVIDSASPPQIPENLDDPGQTNQVP